MVERQRHVLGAAIARRHSRVVALRHHRILAEVRDSAVERLATEHASSIDHGAEGDMELVCKIGGVAQAGDDDAGALFNLQSRELDGRSGQRHGQREFGLRSPR